MRLTLLLWTMSATAIAAPKYAGIYYVTWHNTPNASGVIEHPWSQVWDGGPPGVGPPVPVVGLYRPDYATGQAHAVTLRNMGIDFVIFDATNNTIWGPAHPQTAFQADPLFDNARHVIDGFASVSGAPKASFLLTVTNWDSDNAVTGRVQRDVTRNYNAPGDCCPEPPAGGMCFPWIPRNAGDLFAAKVHSVYDDYVANPSRYFIYEGKPMLFLFVSSNPEIKDSCGNVVTSDGKLPDTWNPTIITTTTPQKTIRDLFTIRWVGSLMAGTGNQNFVPTSGDTTRAYHGHWSWEDAVYSSCSPTVIGGPTWASRPSAWGDFPEAMTVSAYQRIPCVAGRLSQGTFNNMWKRVLDVDPEFVIIHSWNEFSNNDDEASAELSQSIEPTTNYFGNSYEQAAAGWIQQFKAYRGDIAMYDTVLRALVLKNRNNSSSLGSGFSFETTYLMDMGTSDVETFSADFNGDGKTDFGLRNRSNGQIAIRYAPFFTVESTAGQPGQALFTLASGANLKIAAGDFNSDGEADLAFYDTTLQRVLIHYNYGIYGFLGWPDYVWNWSMGSTIQLGATNINASGGDDLVVRNTATGLISFGINPGNFSTAPTSTFSFPWASGAHYNLLTGRFEGDSLGDIGLRDSTTGHFYFLHNLGYASGSTWNFGYQDVFLWSWVGGHLLPATGDWR